MVDGVGEQFQYLGVFYGQTKSNLGAVSEHTRYIHVTGGHSTVSTTHFLPYSTHFFALPRKQEFTIV